MAYNEQLAIKVRKALEPVINVTEKRMFGGLAFMVNDKICVTVLSDKKEFNFWIKKALDYNKKLEG